MLRRTILAEKRRSRQNSLGREGAIQNPTTILKNSQSQETTNADKNPIRPPSPHVRFQRAASVQVPHHPNSHQTASACAILSKIPAVRGLMADTILREGENMAANQPSSEKKTVAFKDKVIDSRITKKAKPKTISLADILSKLSDYTQPSVQQYPSNDPPPPVQEYPMDYPRPPVQQHPTNYL